MATDLGTPDLISSLRSLADEHGLAADKLQLQFEFAEPNKPIERQKIKIVDNKGKAVTWRVDSLRGLFRGQGQPRPDLSPDKGPQASLLMKIETEVVALCQSVGDLTDQEFEELFTTLRRRPDGRSLGLNHDLLWQIAAFAVAFYPTSQAEFEWVFNRLAQSTRTFHEGQVSRNYIKVLRRTLHVHSASCRHE